LTDRVENSGDGLIVGIELAFQLDECRRQFFITGERFAQSHEGALLGVNYLGRSVKIIVVD